MKISLVQTHLFWQDREKNLSHLSQTLDRLTEKSDLIVLPEMFSTAFTMEPEKFAEKSDGPSLAFLKNYARKKKCIITGSVAVEDKKKYYNRLFWVRPEGGFSTYDKRHLFRMAGEDEHYTPGKKKLIVSAGKWNICPLICYDLRFPVWSRNRFDKAAGTWEYDVLIYVANWPKVRRHPWQQLLIARAIENQCYVIGVNRIGKDGNGYEHSGDSVVINPRGEVIKKIKAGRHAIETVSLDRKYLNDFRKAFPAGMDADEFRIQL